MGGTADHKFTVKLADAVRQGDKAAFSQLYDNYSAALYGVCLRMLEDEAEAQDALQSAMVKAWRNFSSFDHRKAGLYTWLLNITRNDCIDRIRSNGRKPAIMNIDSSAGVVERQGKFSDYGVKVDNIGLREAVDRLDGDLRQVIDAAYFKGYTQQEISDEFNLPLGTVKTRMRTAIRELRKVFA